MEGGAALYNPRTVEEVFKDFKGRRTAIVKALTTGKNFTLFSDLSASSDCYLLRSMFNFLIDLSFCFSCRCSRVLPTM